MIASLPPYVAERVHPEPMSGCWLWSGATNGDGYGDISHKIAGSTSRLAHRAIFEVLAGPIPTGLVCDHLCRNRACVNPLHIEIVTIGENALRGVGWHAMSKRKTRCLNGHPFDESNTYVHPVTGHRWCKRCRADRMRAINATRRLHPTGRFHL